MELTVLSVPDCPNVAMLQQRLVEVLGERSDVHLVHHVVADDAAAARLGMRGSPTLLIDGHDPFTRPGLPLSVSRRL